VALPYESLAFLTGAASLRGLPEDDGREAAFAGRSNAGKSSALNAVAARRALARTSKTPGRTREINFFRFASGQRLADLPGYGFARAPADARQRWAALVEAYLQRRRSLVGVVLLMDVRRPLTDLDWQMVRWCDASRVPVHAVLTKADKLGRGAASAALRSVRESLASLAEPAGAQLLSATRGDGLDALRGRLDSWLDPVPGSLEDAVGS
jgi:GTP-binding protein